MSILSQISAGLRAISRLLANHCIFPSLRNTLFRWSGISLGKDVYTNMGLYSLDSYEKGWLIIEDQVALSPNVTFVSMSSPFGSFLDTDYQLEKKEIGRAHV